jgi:hypothetical protein
MTFKTAFHHQLVAESLTRFTVFERALGWKSIFAASLLILLTFCGKENDRRISHAAYTICLSHHHPI